jgi:hypothetical protein
MIMADKETLLELIEILKTVQEDAKTVAALKSKVDLMLFAIGGIYTAFWGYILLTILVK